MKRLVTLLLALTLLCVTPSTLLAEDNAQSILPYAGEDEITITMLGWQSYSHYNWDNMFGQYLKSQLGNIKIESEIPDDDTATLINMYLATGEMPDIMMFRDADEFMRIWAETGVALNLLDYAEYMPNYMAHRETFPHLSRYDKDGAAYMIFPCRYDGIAEAWFANKDLLDKYDLEVPKTYDEMVHCMEVVCPQESGIYGITTFYSWGLDTIYGTIGGLLGQGEQTPTSLYYDYDQSKWVFELTENEEACKKTVEELKKLYDNGFIAKDMLSWDDTMRDAVSDSGRFLFNRPYASAMNRGIRNGVNVVYMDPPVADGVTPYAYTPYESDGTGWIYFINAKTEHPEICAAILDLITSDEYAKHYYWGEEGVTYTEQADGSRAYTEEYLSASDDEKKEKYGIARTIPYFTDPFASLYAVGDALCASNEDAINDCYRISAEKLASGEYTTYKAALAPIFDEVVKEDIDAAMNAIKTYVNENVAAFIIGTRDLGEWDTFVDGLSNYGDIDWVLEQYNSAELRPLRANQFERVWLMP